MPRLPRFFLPSVPLHVIQRGNNRTAIFRDAPDFAFMCSWMLRAARRHRVAIHAYVLMTNHMHVLGTPESPTSMPKMMQSLGRAYVRYFNETYERTGTLFEGRYKAGIVDDERYLLSCMRYIELNPVRAGLARAPADYPWSSFGTNACGTHDPLVTPHPVYFGLDRDERVRSRRYQELFGSALPEADIAAIRDATQNGWAAGSAAFRKRVTAFARRSERLPKGPKRAVKSVPEIDSDPILESSIDSDPN
ncbi:MAG: transposase [Burkholderiales bacterium]|nr:transposase [Burkholderiales bacterium]